MNSVNLQGSSWILTRPHDRSASWTHVLERHGAFVFNDPVLKLQPIPTPVDFGMIRVADLLVFSSATTVKHFFSLLSVPLQNFMGEGQLPRVAAVGKATADALRDHGLPVEIEGPGTGAEDLVKLIVSKFSGGSAVHVTSDAGLPVIVDGLGTSGISCQRLEVSQSSLVPGLDVSRWREVRSDWTGIVYSSPATVRGVLDQAGDLGDWVRTIPGVAVGERTGSIIREAGIQHCVVAASADEKGLLGACASVISTVKMNQDLNS